MVTSVGTQPNTASNVIVKFIYCRTSNLVD